MKRIVSFVLMCLMVLSLNAQNDAKKVKITTDPGSKSELKVPGYVDLGLPSGTLWKNEDEEGLYSFYLAMSNFGDNLPSREQMEELRNSCEWKWTGKGYKVIGPNGSSIYLSASGYQDCNKEWNRPRFTRCELPRLQRLLLVFCSSCCNSGWIGSRLFSWVQSGWNGY